MWYLVGLPSYKNLRERLKELMDRKHFCLPEVEERSSDAIKASAQGSADTGISSKAEPQTEPEPEKHYRTIPPSPYQRPPGMSYNEFQKQVRRDKRVGRYEDVRMLVEQGLSQRTIARKLKKTVRKFVQAEAYPERHASKAGVCLTPTRATCCILGNKDAATACSSTMRSQRVATKARLRCSENLLQS
jgi:hypothetical protein